MNPEELKRRLRDVFLEELDEHVRELERDALAFESERGAAAQNDLQQRLFRAAHGLKGAARSVGAREVESACHALEQSLEELRRAPAGDHAGMAGVLLAHVDRVRAAGLVFANDVPRGALPSVVPPAIPPVAVPLPPPTRVRVHVENSATPLPPMPAPAASRTPVLAPAGPAAASAALPVAAPPRVVDTRSVRLSRDKLDALLTRSNALDEHVRDVAACAVDLEQLARSCRQLAHSASAGAETRSPEQRGQQVASLRDLARQTERLQQTFEQGVRALARSCAALDEDVRAVRMVPLAQVCEGFDRSVRDLAASLGKQIRLDIADDRVEVDRSVAQRLREPLLHVVRNSVSHGVELPAAREASRKPVEGRIAIAARMLGSEIEISVADDGRGFDRAAIAKQLDRMGLSAPEGQDIVRAAFLPAVSTATEITEMAGRGVGLDAVKRSIEALCGTVDVDSEDGQGARVALRVPTTLSRLRCLYIKVGESPFALPCTHVERLVRFDVASLTLAFGTRRLLFEGSSIVAIDAEGVLGMSRGMRGAREGSVQALLISHDGRRVALMVDALEDERDATVHALPPRALQSELVMGAISVPGGSLVPLLSAASLLRRALDLPQDAKAVAPDVARRILVVDDSVTTRAVLRSILEDAGYRVTSAEHGRAALVALERETFDLMVSDVQMPELDGIELTEQVRRDARFQRLPVVLVTALAAESDRTRGLHAGANAYLTKSAFDHRALLDTVRSLIGGEP